MQKPEVALILGNGPSLNELNFQEISSDPRITTFATNRIDVLFERTTWRPDYYTCFTSLSREDQKWKQSIRNVAECKQTKCFVMKHCKQWLGNKSNVEYVDVIEHNRHGKIPDNLFAADFFSSPMKSYSATTSLFQLAFSLGFKNLLICGQDGYDMSRSINHFSPSYGYDPGNFAASNDRLLRLHRVIKAHCENNSLCIKNLSRSSILNMYELSNTFRNKKEY